MAPDGGVQGAEAPESGAGIDEPGAEGPPVEELHPVASRAKAAAEATRPMKAIRGRASFLGERSIGHLDPGARSSALMIAAVCDAIGG